MTRLEKYTVWGSTVAVTATGIVYAWMKYLLKPADAFAVVNHPLQPLVLKLHIVSAPILVFGIGMITMRHIWPHFRKGMQRGRRSGVSGMLFMLPMIISGYALQALTSMSWPRVLGYLHLVLGCIFALATLVHAFVIKGTSIRQQMLREPPGKGDDRKNGGARQGFRENTGVANV